MKAIPAIVAKLVERHRWLRIVRAAARGFLEQDGLHYAAGMAYYSLLALFQLAVLGVVVLSFIVGGGVARAAVIEQMSTYAPIERETVAEILDAVLESRGGASLLAMPFLLFGGLGLFGALRTAINRVFHVPEPRPLLRQQLIQLLLMGALGLLFAASLVIRFVASVVQELMERMPLPGTPFIAEAVGLAVPFGLATVAFITIYRVVPNRTISTRAVWPSALVAAVGWTALVSGFSLYAARVARYDTVFGPLSSAILLLTFLFFASVITLAGAALAHAIMSDARDGPTA